LVPSFAAFTPVPARAFVTPFGNKTAGQIFRHWAEQGVLFAFNVYSVVPLTRIVPICASLAVEMTMLLAR
jgi:hypothetical protein